MEQRRHNPTRWREYELILITIFCLFGIAGSWWKIFEYRGAELRDRWGRQFAENHVDFDFFINVLLPETGLLVMIYIAYFWMNLYILPRLVQVEAAEPGRFRINFSLRGHIDFSGPGGETLKRFLWGLANAIALILLLGIGWGVVIYYRREYEFSGMDWTSLANRVLGLGWKNSAGLVVLYTGYAFIRELSIRKLLSDPKRNAFRIELVNQISTYVLVYFTVGFVLYFFNIVDDDVFFIVFWAIAPVVLLSAITNIYWIFPLVGEKGFFRRPILRRILLSTLAWSAIVPFFLIPDSPSMVEAVLSLWCGQLFIGTPLSWVIFRLRKD
ncbi:MAG TPA: hypothetical protein VKQ52_05060, partial [Puia sp.]|nr:hypothetical protein [Puia sp.]